MRPTKPPSRSHVPIRGVLVCGVFVCGGGRDIGDLMLVYVRVLVCCVHLFVWGDFIYQSQTPSW